VTSVIAEKRVCTCFLNFYILQEVPSKRRRARGNLPPYSPFQWDWVG